MPRVAVVLCSIENDVATSPTLINSAHLLAEAGFDVVFFAPAHYHALPEFDEPRISMHVMEATPFAQDQGDAAGAVHGLPAARIRRHLRDSLPSRLVAATRPGRERAYRWYYEYLELYLWLRRTVRFQWWLRNHLLRSSYDCYVGVDANGLVAAWIAAARSHVPVVYLSLELHLANAADRLWMRAQKAVERRAARSMAFGISQDHDRIAHLCDDLGTFSELWIAVPVGARPLTSVEKSWYLQDSLGIDRGTVIVLHAGQLAHWGRCLEIARHTDNWPRGTCLVLHGHADPDYLRELLQYHDGCRVIVSTQFVPYSLLPRLIVSAHIGLALYRDIDENFSLVANASGKIAHYLQCGIPIIVSDAPGLRQLVETYRCGLWVEDESEIGAAVARILERYDSFRVGALECYSAQYSFDDSFGTVVDRLRRLAQRAPSRHPASL